MTLASFQRAYADLAASPDLCLAVRADPSASLARYELTDRERNRLAAAVWQRGMDANCTLYRATRITALNSVLPLTLGLLRDNLRDLLDDYWADHPVHDIRFASEARRFIDWLEGKIAHHSEAVGLIALARRELAAEEARLRGELSLPPA